MNSTPLSTDPTEPWLNALFEPVQRGNEVEQLSSAISSFENLTGYYIESLLGRSAAAEKVLKEVHIDYVGLASMIKHFQRDAFGVWKFEEYTRGLVTAGKVDKNICDEVLEEVKKLGLRVTADAPRKTRIAATFSLWMCVYRPVTLNSENLPQFAAKHLELFCAALNFWIASLYLEKFGRIVLYDLPDSEIRLERIKHDFTCREASFSTLETMYAALFRYPEKNEHRLVDGHRGPVIHASTPK